MSDPVPINPLSSNGIHDKKETASLDDDYSNLTDDQSLVSRVSSKIGSVLGRAGKILSGENPDGIQEEELDAYDLQQSKSPLGLEDSSFGASRSSKGDALDFLKDDPSTMTYGRRIALNFMEKGWYNPRAGKQPELEEKTVENSGEVANGSNGIAASIDEKREARATVEAYPFTHSKRENPSLERAWAYFDHVALPRFVVEPKPAGPKKNILQRIIRKFQKGDEQMDRAEPGEKYLSTKLYDPLWTPTTQLGDFGLGFGLYFATLKALAVLTFVAGLINIPNFIYFSSDEYSGNQGGVPSLIKGSAICTSTQWVLCKDCVDKEFEPDRIATGVHLETGANATFALRNLCDGATIEQGFVSLGTVVFILVGIISLSYYLRRMEVAFDEDEQTAQDYGVLISNPPGDATDPEEWRKFFADRFDGARVTALTIAVDNDFLVRSLVGRRETLRKIEMMVEPGTSLDTLTIAGIAARQERDRKFFGRLLAMISPGIPELFAQLVVLTAKVQGLSQQDYPATNIFITFETEADQRHVLSCLNIGSLAAKRNRKTALTDPKYLFRDEYVLAASEPDEPNTVRWEDLNEKFKDKAKQMAFTTFSTCAAVALIAFIIFLIEDYDEPLYPAIAIAVFNSVFPMFAKFLTDTESHASEGGKQRSLYFKIALFRWVNTAIVITIITPFTSTLEDGKLVQQVYALFFAEIVTTNLIQLIDPVGHLQRHFLAPRANSQDAMNLCMQGQVVELAERYTNMTKILFLALWYSAVYPGALFMCAFALMINFFTDRFSLMRTWKRAPSLGPETSAFSRSYFFSLAVAAMGIVSSYFWAGFPFDNVCATNVMVAEQSVFKGTWNVTTSEKFANPSDVDLANDKSGLVEVEAGDFSFQYCLQDFFRYEPDERKFPFIPAFQREGLEWMTDDQEVVTAAFGWFSVGVLCLILLKFCYGWLSSITGLFRGTYDPRGDDQQINFSDVPSISTYVPEVQSKVFSYPLLACNFDGIDEDLLDWADPDRPISFYDLTKDADILLRDTDVTSKVVFSQIFHWPPPPSLNEAPTPKT